MAPDLGGIAIFLMLLYGSVVIVPVLGMLVGIIAGILTPGSSPVTGGILNQSQGGMCICRTA